MFEQADGTLAGSSDRIGQVSWTITDAGQATPSGAGDRYLRHCPARPPSTEITTSSTFRHTFGAADALGIFIVGVRFTGTTYAPGQPAGRGSTRGAGHQVTVASDRARYRPASPSP
jgi:hypothetical protein